MRPGSDAAARLRPAATSHAWPSTGRSVRRGTRESGCRDGGAVWAGGDSEVQGLSASEPSRHGFLASASHCHMAARASNDLRTEARRVRRDDHCLARCRNCHQRNSLYRHGVVQVLAAESAGGRPSRRGTTSVTALLILVGGGTHSRRRYISGATPPAWKTRTSNSPPEATIGRRCLVGIATTRLPSTRCSA